MSDSHRISALNDRPVLGERPLVIYWMQASQRVRENPAFSFACSEADRLGKPLLVFFGVCASFPRAGRRQYRFMLEGLRVVRDSLRQNGIRFMLSLEGPVQVCAHRASGACVTTFLRKEPNGGGARSCGPSCLQNDPGRSNVVVPVEPPSKRSIRLRRCGGNRTD